MSKIKRGFKRFSKWISNVIKFIAKGGNKLMLPKLKTLKKHSASRKVIGGFFSLIYIVLMYSAAFLSMYILLAAIIFVIYGLTALVQFVLFPNSGVSAFILILVFNFGTFFGTLIYFFFKGKLIKKIKEFYEG